MQRELALCRTNSPRLDLAENQSLFTPLRREELSRRPLEGQRESVAGRLLLAQLLSSRCPEAALPPRIQCGEWEKPRLTDFPNIHFNISHSEGWAVCALCDGEVGVDLQHNRNINLSIARRFAPSEQAMLEAFPREEQSKALCDLWSLKEAWCKCTGEGLSAPLDAAVFTLDPVSIDRPGFQVLRLTPPEPEWSLAVCVRTEEPLEVFQRILAL